MKNLVPPHIDLGICPLCKGAGFRKDSDFNKEECICEETGQKYYLYEPSPNMFSNCRGYIKMEYQDKTLLDKLQPHMQYGRINHEGIAYDLYINAINRLEPFYSLKDYNLNNYDLPPLEDPIFPFRR